MIDLSYPNVLTLIQTHLKQGRTESRAFLAWFLENYYRLESDAARDSVCDGPDDKGIDGIYVDDNLETIDVFQSKLFQNTKRTLGDPHLKQQAGTLTQFADPENVQSIADTTQNKELSNLIGAEDVPKKLRDGYSVRGVLVTNVNRDPAANAFLARQPNMMLYDAAELQYLYVPLGPTGPMSKPVIFEIGGHAHATYKIDNTKVIIVPLKAVQLIQLDGIASGALFAWNVRQSLGKTKVNKEIGASIEERAEHRNFLLYHNGLTILCESIKERGQKIEVSGYTVVNGCQSLTTLYEHRNHLSDELLILARLIELDPEGQLAAKITHHSNNQNPISARDLQSNSAIQRRLQKEFEQLYPGEIFYRIKRGETTTLPVVIDNQDAARVLLAFDRQEPWTCHQTYKLFDELHAHIFARPEVNAHRIVAFSKVYEAVLQSLYDMQNRLMAEYTLTRYFLLYLLRQALQTDPEGQKFCQDPTPYLQEPNGRERILLSMTKVLKDLIIDLNAELRQRDEAGNSFDYKREFKSPTAIRALERNIIPPYQMAVSRGRALSFAGEWRASAP